MKEKLSRAFHWVLKFFSSSEEASMKRLCYLMAVISAIVWLSCALHSHGLTDMWRDSFESFVGFVTGGYVGGKGLDVIYKTFNKESSTTVTPVQNSQVDERG